MPTALGLDFDHEAGAEHLHGKLRHRAHQHDMAALKQRDAVADPLHLVEHVRRQQHRNALGLELADQVEEFERRLRIEP